MREVLCQVPHNRLKRPLTDGEWDVVKAGIGKISGSGAWFFLPAPEGEGKKRRCVA
jgi:hypothetical protein